MGNGMGGRNSYARPQGGRHWGRVTLEEVPGIVPYAVCLLGDGQSG